jgi:hypothetical protein
MIRALFSTIIASFSPAEATPETIEREQVARVR